MARKSNRNGRDPSPIARPSLHRSSTDYSPVNLALYQDHRSFHPEGPFRAPLSLLGRPRPRIIAPQLPMRSGKRPRLYQLAFQAPDDVIVCVRRKRRKEVLFAKNKAGKSGQQRKRRRTYFSSISCKR